MDIKLENNERLDDLQYQGLKLIQYTDGYCFNSDSVLLANMVKCNKTSVVAELGAGSGVISILISKKMQPQMIYAIELQERLFNLLTRNIKINDLDNIIPILAPMQTVKLDKLCDIVVTNPPYTRIMGKMVSAVDEIAICRQEVMVTLVEIIKSASRLLKYGGLLYIIYKAERLIELINAMTECNMTPKEIISIMPKPDKDIDTVIVVAKKGGRAAGLKMKTLTVFNPDNTMSDKCRKLYNKP